MFSLSTVWETISHAIHELHEEAGMGPGKTGAPVGRHKPIAAM